LGTVVTFLHSIFSHLVCDPLDYDTRKSITRQVRKTGRHPNPVGKK